MIVNGLINYSQIKGKCDIGKDEQSPSSIFSLFLIKEKGLNKLVKVENLVLLLYFYLQQDCDPFWGLENKFCAVYGWTIF